MISVTILTKDSAKQLPSVLDAVRGFDEVVVLDSGSSDDTLAVARRFLNVKIHRSADSTGAAPAAIELSGDAQSSRELLRSAPLRAFETGRVWP
jgi:GT2 family glycosyltransferase